MGVNALRLAHYPQAEYFYRLCDYYGIVVWAEIPVVDLIGGSGTFNNPDNLRKEFFNTTKHKRLQLFLFLHHLHKALQPHSLNKF